MSEAPAIQKFRQTDRDTVSGTAQRPITLRSLWDSQQTRSRLRASIPDTFPLRPPSILHVLHPPYNCSVPQLSSPFTPCLHNSLPLFQEQEGQKSRLLVTGTVLPWRQGKEKRKKENWGTVQGGSNKGSSVLLLSGAWRA